MTTWPRIALIAVVLLAAACSTARATPESRVVAAAWVEIGPRGSLPARAIVEGATCPELTVDGSARPMKVRAGADGASFPVTVCEAPLAAGAREIAVDGQALPRHPLVPRRILVIGDTGCRMEAPSDFQACNDGAAWPFAKMVARAAAWRPDLVIHVGDYHYRESACPSGNAGCAGNPVGDTWASWRADFFGPAAPLLRTAPWIFIRGNHESCARAGEGWFRFLEPRARPATCTDDTEPYVVAMGDVVLGVLDSSGAPITQPVAGTALDGATVEPFLSQWKATIRDVDGHAVTEGTLLLGTMRCVP